MNVFRHRSDMMDVGVDRNDFGVTVKPLANGDSRLDAMRA